MGRYSIKSLNIPLVPQDNRNKLTDEEKRKRELRSKKLREYGVYVSMYTDETIVYPEHPDGIHNYLSDAMLAKSLVDEDKELPKDLIDRLKYYKPIMDKQFQE